MHIKSFLHRIFRASDLVAIERFDEAEGIPALDFLIAPIDELNPGRQQFFCVNPLSDISAGRTNLNVSTFINWVFESDDPATPPEMQLERLKAANVLGDFRTVVHSGGKSLHLIVSCADTIAYKPGTPEGVEGYKRIWRGLKDHYERLTGLRFDKSTSNPSRLSRLGGAIRPSNGRTQSVLSEGRLWTADELTGLQAAERALSPVANLNVSSLHAFESLLDASTKTQHLRDTLRYNVHLWAGPENMRPLLLQYALWAIDLTGVTYPILVAYMERYTFPVLVARGYDPRKLREPVESAYEWKGLSAS